MRLKILIFVYLEKKNEDIQEECAPCIISILSKDFQFCSAMSENILFDLCLLWSESKIFLNKLNEVGC
jgi:hypothetical protein